MISPGTYNITAYQGATFNFVATYTISASPVDLTNYTSAMQVRNSYSASATIASLTSSSGITLGGAAGTITVEIDADEMTDIPAGKYVYDLELDSGSEVTRLLQGTFTVEAEVTRS